MKRPLAAGLAAVVLGLASLSLTPHETANETIDTVTTGALPAASTAPAPASVEQEQGSEAFRAALALLAEGNAAEAYAEAEALPDVERRTIRWAAIYFHPGVIDPAAVAAFADEAPDFAASSVYRTRIEQSLAKAEPDASAIIDTLGEAAPNTVEGKIMLAGAYLDQGDNDHARSIVRQLWINNFLTDAQEKTVLERFGPLLDRATHWARATHLMMHDRARASERLLPLLSPAQQSLVVARAAVSRNAADAKALLDKVDASMQAEPVFIFSRAQRARQFELWQSAVDWLAKAPELVPDAEEWWTERRLLIRKLLDAGEPRLAYQVAAGYREGPEGRLVDARFHAGWIALSFLGDADSARTHFTEMAALSTLPDTISQSNYWLARANLKLGDTEGARAALTKAAEYSLVYYGQLARTELGEAGVGLRPLPEAQPAATLFDRQPVVRAVRLLAANGERDKAVLLLRHFGTARQDPDELLLAARLATEIGAPHLSIAIANTTDRQGTPLDSFSFPKEGLPEDAPLAAERAAVFAVARQESMFQIDAVSSAGARGLMQLMPGTAEEVARKVGVDYSPQRLVSDAAYNALLGSTYLGTQLDRYDGSLVLAAAAYNAGPGNANKWLNAYGDPRAANVDPVIWVELIPFQETRTYVKRVLGNYLVYRERLGETPVPLLEALRTIRPDKT